VSIALRTLHYGRLLERKGEDIKRKLLLLTFEERVWDGWLRSSRTLKWKITKENKHIIRT